MRKIHISREVDPDQLQALIKRGQQWSTRNRAQALLLVSRGYQAQEVADLLGIHSRTVSRAVQSYNERGLEGLICQAGGSAPELTEEEEAELRNRVLRAQRADPNHLEHLQGRDLQVWIAEQFEVEYHLSSVYKLLHRLGLSCLRPRPRHPEQDPQAGSRFQNETVPQARQRVELEQEPKNVQSWFQDEMRAGQQGTLAPVWGERGARVIAPRQTDYEWRYLFGAVCPETGELCGLILPEANTAMMNLFLQELSRRIGPERHGLLVLDQAGWHRSGTLVVPINLSLLYLPPYSPELNPAERLWEDLREKDLSNRVYETAETLMDQLQRGWQRLQARPSYLQSLCRCSYLN